MNETVLFVIVMAALSGLAIAVMELMRCKPQGVTHENRAVVARGLFKHFTREE